MVIKGVLRKLGNGVDGSLSTDYMSIYITGNQRVVTKALQGGNRKSDARALERGLTFSQAKKINMIFTKRRS